MGVLSGCKPRDEVLQGDLNDAIFAADFGELIAGTAPPVYGDARVFFENTHPAQQLRKIMEVVFKRLTDPYEPGAVLRLSTGFGGGKTHTLMALWHLTKNIGDSSLGTELLPAAGRPRAVALAAIDASKAGVPVFARHGGDAVRSLWGEIAYQLGGREAWRSLAEVDDPELQPTEEQLRSILSNGPVLLLLDELVIYMATLSQRGQGNLLAFLTKLGAVVGNRPQTALIVTDPGRQLAYQDEATRLGEAIAAGKLDDLLSRKASDFDPIGSEAAQVIVRRLFDRVSRQAAEAASAAYHSLYERVSREYAAYLPAGAASADYAQRIVQCYPFHPRLLETAQDRLGAMQDFQKSRGVLRLFARILRDVREQQEDLELISAGDVDWSSPRIQADLLARLNRDNFKAAISSDVEQHAGELDGGLARGVHRRVASALLLESIPLQASSGLDSQELTLAVLRPEEAGPEAAEALDRLAGVCWHTYPMPGGRGWQFRYEPNVIKQIEERMAEVPLEDARGHVQTAAQGYFQGPAFSTAAWPASAKQVRSLARLQLALCENEAIARSVCAYEDDSNPAAPMPRRFPNAIVAVTSTPMALANAVERAQRLIAAEGIEREQCGEGGKMVREQLQRIMPQLRRQFLLQTYRAFDRAILAGHATYTLEEKYQVSEEEMLKASQGQGCLRRFLEDKHLIYGSGDTLDPERFLTAVLPGATPEPQQPEVYSAKAVHERFLAAPELRLVPDGEVVRRTILKALGACVLAVHFADGRVYDGGGCVEGPEGRRRRIAQPPPSTFELDDKVLLTPAGSVAAAAWTAVTPETSDAEGERRIHDGGLPPPPAPPAAGPISTNSLAQGIELAAARPLIELHLTANSPTDMSAVQGLAPPLGADRLSISVSVGGTLKGGGMLNFSVNDVQPTHAAKPIETARTFFNALAPGGSYEADLGLHFGDGRRGMEEQLRQLAEKLPEGVSVRARFDRPLDAAR